MLTSISNIIQVIPHADYTYPSFFPQCCCTYVYPSRAWLVAFICIVAALFTFVYLKCIYILESTVLIPWLLIMDSSSSFQKLPESTHQVTSPPPLTQWAILPVIIGMVVSLPGAWANPQSEYHSHLGLEKDSGEENQLLLKSDTGTILDISFVELHQFRQVAVWV